MEHRKASRGRRGVQVLATAALHTLGAALILCGAGLAAENPPPPMVTTPEIIVTTPRGRTSGGIDPLLEVSPSELDSYGVDTLSDPQTVFDTQMRLLVGVLNRSDVGAQPFGVPTTN